MYGGVDEKEQKQRLIDGVDVLVATPGRLLDMYGKRAVHFEEVEMLVLDEADRMLDMALSMTSTRSLTACQKSFSSCCSLQPCLTKFVTWLSLWLKTRMRSVSLLIKRPKPISSSG